MVRSEKLQYEVTHTPSVAEAFLALETGHFDVIILDYFLGDGTALDVLRKAPIPKDSATIVVTGTGDEETAVAAMKAGAADYLIKDHEHRYLKVLPVTVEKTLKRAAAECEIREKSQLLNAILSNIPILVLRLDHDGKIIDATGSGIGRFQNNNQSEETSVVGVSVFEFFQRLSPTVVEGIKVALAGGHIDFVSEAALNGRSGFFEVYLFFDDERGEGAVAVAIDTTKKHEAERKLGQVFLGVQNIFTHLNEINDVFGNE